MKSEQKKELEVAVKSTLPLGEVVALLRRQKDQGTTQAEVYSFLEEMHRAESDEAMDDRILEIADFVAGFCAPHMKIWESDLPELSRR